MKSRLFLLTLSGLIALSSGCTMSDASSTDGCSTDGITIIRIKNYINGAVTDNSPIDNNGFCTNDMPYCIRMDNNSNKVENTFCSPCNEYGKLKCTSAENSTAICVDVLSSNTNCGACNTPCDGECINGHCQNYCGLDHCPNDNYFFDKEKCDCFCNLSKEKCESENRSFNAATCECEEIPITCDTRCPNANYSVDETCKCQCNLTEKFCNDLDLLLNPETCECASTVCVGLCPNENYRHDESCECKCYLTQDQCGDKILSQSACECVSPSPFENCTACPNDNYIQSENCMCVCDINADACPKDSVFDHSSCSCLPKPPNCDLTECTGNFSFIQNACKCECVALIICDNNQYLDRDLCDCVDKNNCPFDCPPNYHLDSAKCECIPNVDCEFSQICTEDEYFDEGKCECAPLPYCQEDSTSACRANCKADDPSTGYYWIDGANTLIWLSCNKGHCSETGDPDMPIECVGNLPNGERCEDHADCASGYCIFEICQNKLKTNGASCKYNEECESNNCIDDFCISPHFDGNCVANGCNWPSAYYCGEDGKFSFIDCEYERWTEYQFTHINACAMKPNDDNPYCAHSLGCINRKEGEIYTACKKLSDGTIKADVFRCEYTTTGVLYGFPQNEEPSLNNCTYY